MSIKKLLLMAWASIAMCAAAQTLPEQCEVYRPSMLSSMSLQLKDLEKVAGGNYGQTGSTNEYWTVYSDRSDNSIYADASTSAQQVGKLTLNQEVRIAKIKNGFALVYEEKRTDISYPAISRDARCRGWVPMSNLLLWDICPSDEFGIFRKALFVVNAETGKTEGLRQIFENPNSNTNGRAIESGAFFHYIMKEVGNGNNKRFLMAKYHKIGDGSYSNQVLEGWVTENNFIRWNQRACLEPNWNTATVMEFKGAHKTANLYGDKGLSSVAQSWEFGENPNKVDQESTKFRMMPASMRYPILDPDAGMERDGNICKVTAIGTTDGQKDMVSLQKQVANAANIQEGERESINRINLIFVIAGTTSMKSYFENIAREVKEQVGKRFGDKDVRVGVVIYRSKADGAAAIETYKMQRPGDAGLQKFLLSVGANGATSNKTTLDAALYKGLLTALDTKAMGYSAKQSNFVFVIGETGNDPNDKTITSKQIVDLAKKSYASIFSIQAVNFKSAAYENFTDQMEDICRLTMESLYRKKVQWSPTAIGNFAQPEKPHLAMSFVAWASLGNPFSNAELSKCFTMAYDYAIKANEVQKEIVENGAQDNPIREEFLKTKYGSADDYAAVKKSGMMVGYTGYVKQKDESGKEFWQTVVFLSADELAELNKKLEKLRKKIEDDRYDDAARKAYVDAVTALVKSFQGQSTATNFDELDTDAITRVIAGLNKKTPILRDTQSGGKYTLGQIKNSNACPNNEFRNILINMRQKIDRLSKIAVDYPYSFKQNGQTYYWIPITEFP